MATPILPRPPKNGVGCLLPMRWRSKSTLLGFAGAFVPSFARAFSLIALSSSARSRMAFKCASNFALSSNLTGNLRAAFALERGSIANCGSTFPAT